MPVEGRDELKRTNEIGMFIPLVDTLDIAGKTITADALLTQRKQARYLVDERSAHYGFTVKENQPSLAQAIRLLFEQRGEPDYREPFDLEHGRLESRAIWTSTKLNDYQVLNFNRGHWVVENHHYILDWNWNEDRCTLRTGHGPANITRLRRFATGLIKSKTKDTVASTIQKLPRNTRLVFDYLRMTNHSISPTKSCSSQEL